LPPLSDEQEKVKVIASPKAASLNKGQADPARTMSCLIGVYSILRGEMQLFCKRANFDRSSAADIWLGVQGLFSAIGSNLASPKFPLLWFCAKYTKK